MRKVELRDVLFFLPGIGGSVLERDGKPLWAPTAGAGWRFLTRPQKTLAQLRLAGDDPQRDVLDDGIRAVSLVQNVHLIPGLWKIDAYSAFKTMISEAVALRVGSASDADASPANYFEFPYDWRRDNRGTARRLQRFVEERLHRWRRETPFKKAKAIIVAHSMGGLVARYYLEVYGGFRDCRALITLGTPFRGSVKALDFLANGHRILFSDLKDVVRSLPSVYQLLPRYEVLDEEGVWRRVAETEAEIPGIERARAVDALEFHREIDAAVEARAERGYELIPIVGTWQPTLQSARVRQGRVTVDEVPPTWTEFPPGEGDGTVPRVSAVPIELSDALLNTFVTERHASMQGNARGLQDLHDRLIQSQVHTGHILGDLGAAQLQPAPAASAPPALALEVDDLYSVAEPIVLRAAVRNIAAGDVSRMSGRVLDAVSNATVYAGEFSATSEGFHLALPKLPAGTYRVEATAMALGDRLLDPVHDVLAVAEV